MDYKFYEDLLDNMIFHMYGSKIKVDEKGIFEWNRNNEGTISYRSINKLHRFEIPQNENQKSESSSKIVYRTFKNSFYISELTSENTFDIYTTGGGMTKRFTFKKNGSKIAKIKDIVITIR